MGGIFGSNSAKPPRLNNVVIQQSAYGVPISTGLNLNDNGIILLGAVPAALLAILLEGLFDVLERFVVPLGLRLDAKRAVR